MSDVALPAHYGPVAEVPVELRGAGQSSRQVRNFGTPQALAAGSIIYALVLILGGASIISEAITIVLYGAVLYYLNQPGIKSLFGRA